MEREYIEARILRVDELIDEKIQRIVSIPLHHQPGLRHTYSIATDVLGYLVELISGMPLDEFFKQRFFEPLEMVDTDFYVPAGKVDRLAALYTTSPLGGLIDVTVLEGDPTQFPFFLWTDRSIKSRFLSGGGGLVSTASDYYKFASLLRGKGSLDGVRLISRKTIEMMTAIHLRGDRFFVPGCGYGFGVIVVADPAEAQIPASVGAYAGGGAANTEFWYDPVEDLLGVLMTQFISYTPNTIQMDFKVAAMQAIDD